MFLLLFLSFQIKLLKQPAQHSFLIWNSRPSDLSQQVNSIRFWQCCVLQALIAVRANRAKILWRIIATF